jgi:hypothetical protein
MTPTVGKDAKIKTEATRLPISTVVPSLTGYAKAKAIAATTSATTTTPTIQATLAAVRSVTIGPPTF